MILLHRKWLLILLILLSFTTLIKAQTTKADETGKIYFLRSSGWGGTFSNFKFYIDDKFVCKAKYKRYSIHEVPSGRHNLKLQYGNKDLKTFKNGMPYIEVQVESAKSLYYELVYETGLFTTLIYFKELDENTAKEKMKQMKENTSCL